MSNSEILRSRLRAMMLSSIAALLAAVVVCVFAPTVLRAQSVANYVPSRTTSISYTTISGTGSSIPSWRNGTSTDDNRSTATNIGFTFYYMGTPYTQFSVSTNGFLDFSTNTRVGAGTAEYGYENTMFSTAAGTLLTLAPMYENLVTAGNPGTLASLDASIKYQVTGTAPNRILTVEWIGFEIGTNTGVDLNFQVKLYETSGLIEYVYGTMTDNAATWTYTTGINWSTMSATPLTAELLTQQTVNTATFSNTPSNALATLPETNSKIAITPSAPTPAAPTSITFPAVYGGGMVVGWTDNSTTETYFTVSYSPNNVTFIEVGRRLTKNTGTTSDTLNLPVPGLSPGTTYYFRVTANTEGTAPSAVLSGTQATSTCSSGLSGTMSIGPSGTYSSLTAAGLDIYLKGLAGNLILELQSTYVSSVETFPIVVPQFACAGPSATVTVRPASGATALSITSAAAQTINMLGADYVIFDGRPGGTGSAKELTIENTSAAGIAVLFVNDATNNTLQFLTLKGVNSSTAAGTVTFSTALTGGTGNDYMTIDNCDIRDGATTPTYGIYASGSTTLFSQFNSGVTISNNNIYNFFNAGAADAGLYLSTGNSSWSITGNRLYQTATRTHTSAVTHTAIFVGGGNGFGFVVNNNTIGGDSPTPAGNTVYSSTLATQFAAISMNVGVGAVSSVQGNRVYKMSITSGAAAATTPGSFTGIQLLGGDVNVGTSAGNTIGDSASTGSIAITHSVTSAQAMGIQSASAGTVTISGNTVAGMTISGSTTSVTPLFVGINVSAGANNTVSSNVVGSFLTANSIAINTPGTIATSLQSLTGISASGGSFNAVTNNLVSNLDNAHTNSITGSTIRGIMATAGVVTITGNTVRKLTCATSSTTTTAGSEAVIGIWAGTTLAGSTVSGNTVYGLRSTTATAAVRVAGITLASVTTGANMCAKNFVHSLSSASSGLGSIVGIFNSGALYALQNNMIRLGYDETGAALTTSHYYYGIFHSTATNSPVLFNTVYIGGTGVGTGSALTYAFMKNVTAGTTSVHDIRNNIFVNERSNGAGTGKHYAYQLIDTTRVTSDANLYRASGTGAMLASLNNGTTDRATLQALRENAGGRDLYSAVGDPVFMAPTLGYGWLDLHINGAGGTPVEGSGIAVASVTDDYDGNARGSFSPVDIGADADNFASLNDLFTPNIAYTVLANTTSTSNRTLSSVAVTDVGTGVPTSGGNVPRIWYSNQTTASSWASTAGTLSSGTGNSGLWSFTIDYSLIGGTPNIGDVILYYVVAQDQAGTPNVWYQPFTGALHTDVNTRTTSPSNAASYTIMGAPLAGTVNVGPSQTYPTLTGTGGLFQAINNSGLSGNVTALVVGDITEPGTHALNQWAGTYTLAIQPDAAVLRTLSGAVTTTNGMIRMNGADRVTIDGRFSGTGQYLLFRNTATSQPTLSFAADASLNTIQYSLLESANTASTGPAGVVYFGSGTTTGNNSNLITNCDIRDLSVGSGTPTFALFSQGVSSTAQNTSNTVSNCNIFNFFSATLTTAGVYLSSNNTDWTISGNRFYQTASRTYTNAVSHYPIFLSNAGNNFTVANNIIGFDNAGGTGSYTLTAAVAMNFIGVYVSVGTTTASNIRGNTIAGHTFTTTSTSTSGGGAWSGMYIVGGLVNIGVPTGNVIGNAASTGSITTTAGAGGMTVGISNVSSSTVTISNNTIAGITANGSATNAVTLNGILSTTGTAIISNNTIGSTTTANSLAIATTGTAGAQNVHGINITSGTTTISNNVVSNLHNAHAPTVTSTQGMTRGIYIAAGATSVSGNTVRKLSCASPYAAGAGYTSSVVGIATFSSTAPNFITGNTVTELSNTATTASAAAVSVTGIAYWGPSGLSNLVSRNTVNGLTITGSTLATTSIITGIHTQTGVTIQNNSIHLGVDAAGAAITTPYIFSGIRKLTGSIADNIYHNSVWIGGTGVATSATNATAAYVRTVVGSSTVIDSIKNNIFVNVRSNSGGGGGTHYAFFTYDTLRTSSDFNIYLANGTGGAIGTVNNGTTARATLQALREGYGAPRDLGSELSSAVADPGFSSTGGASNTVDLHLSGTTAAEAAGQSNANVTDDFDGQSRPGLTPTDIGSDAGNFTASDVFTPNITYTPLSVATNTSNRTLASVSITDVGTGVPTSGGNVPRVWYRNQTAAPAVWGSMPGSLSSGTGNNGLWSFTIDYSVIGGAPSTGDVIQYYVVAQDQAGTPNIWYTPFAGASHTDVNTQLSFPTTPRSYTIGTSYVEVGSGKPYTSLTNTGGLFEYLNSVSLSGDLEVRITSDILTEAGTVALNQWAESGSGGYKVIIRPDGSTLRTLSGAVTAGLIRFNGADRVVIDGGDPGSGNPSTGKYLTFRNTSTSGPVFLFQNDATSSVLRNLIIEGACTTTGGVISFSTTTGTTGNDNNTITYCQIRDLTTAAAYPLYGIYASGTNTTNERQNSGNVISNNAIFNVYTATSTSASASIYLLTGNTDWTISNNRIFQTAARVPSVATTTFGIYISNTTTFPGNNFTIAGNTIGFADSLGAGTWSLGSSSFASLFYGVYLSVGTGTASNVNGNTISGLNYTALNSVPPYFWTGISAGGLVNIGTTTGNTIGSGTATGAIALTFAGPDTAIGIQVLSGSVAVANNTIGGITLTASPTTVSSSIVGIQVLAGATNISGNTIGSGSIANSINAVTASTASIAQIVAGINVTGGTQHTVTNNTIANMTNAYAGTTSVTSGAIRGIAVTTGAATVSGNTARNLSIAAPITATLSTASAIGIYYATTTAPNIVSQNSIYEITNTAVGSPAPIVNVIGLYMAGATGGSNVVDRNFVYNLGASTTNRQSSLIGICAAGGFTTYRNNMVRLGLMSTGSLTTEFEIEGIYKTAAVVQNYYFNSVYIGGTGVGSGSSMTYAFRRTGITADDIRNNIFVNDRSNAGGGGKHYAFMHSAATISNSDYNIFNAGGTGGTLFSLDGGTTDILTLPVLRLAFTGQELNSGVGSPNFTDPANAAAPNLHVSTPTAAEGAGIAIAGITDDYDGGARASLTPTDIGADAGAFSSTDIFTPNIAYTALGNTNSTSNRTLSGATITDATTGVPTAGGNRPKIWYRKSAPGSPSAWASNAGTLTSGTGTNGVWSFTIDYSLIPSYTAASGDSIQYYIVAQDQAGSPNIWYQPFAGAAHSDVNTQTTAPLFPSAYIIGGTLAGTYPVGTGQTYTSLTGAAGIFAAINSGALSGNVTLQIVSDLTEDGTNGLNQWSETGAGNYTLSIVPDGTTERVISGNVSVYGGLIRLNGADRVTVDGRYSGSGKYLRFRNSSIAQGVFTFINDATSNTIRNITAESADSSAINGAIAFLSGVTSGNDNNTITECDIRDLTVGTGWPRYGVYNWGNTANTTVFNSGVTVSNCNIYNFFIDPGTHSAFTVLEGSADWTISGNSMYQTSTRTMNNGQSQIRGIGIQSDGGGFVVSGNYYGGSAPACGGSAMTTTTTTQNYYNYGIAIYKSSMTSPTNIQGNTVANINHTTVMASGAATIFFIGSYAASGTVYMGTTTGNTIGSPTGTGSITLTSNGVGSPVYIGMGYNGAGNLGGGLENNTIGSFTMSGTGTGATQFMGIYSSGQSGAFSISNNTIGSTSTANSVNLLSTALPAQIYGAYIFTGTTATLTVASNTIANLTANSTSSTTQLKGIFGLSTPVATYQGNQIYNLSTSSTNTSPTTSCALSGLVLSGGTTPLVVTQNTIHSLTATNSSAGAINIIGLYYPGPSGSGNVVSRNLIHSLSSASTSPTPVIYGLYQSSGTGAFANNMIRLGFDAAGNPVNAEHTFYGIYKASSSNSLYYHNSVYLGGNGVGATPNNTYAFYRFSAGVDDFRNNIFVNARSNAGLGAGKHYAYYLASTATLTSDYNIYRANGTGGVLAYTGADRNTLQLLRENLYPQELHSGAGDPIFVNPTGSATTGDLHLSSPNPAEGAGIAIAAVSDDYDGQTRSGYTPADIGADAGSFTTSAGTDIFTPGIAYSPLGPTGSTSNRTLSGVLVTDVSTGVPTSGGNVPRVWFRNQTTSSAWASTAGTLSAGNGNSGTWDFTIDYSLIGGAPSGGDIIRYYVAAQDQATTPNVWYEPFLGASHSDVNTQITAPTTPNFYQITTTTFSGTYNVGAGQTFTSLTNPGGLFEAINTGSLTGNVTALITSDLTEYGNNALNPWGGSYTLTISPDAASERLISGNVSTTYGMIRFFGADNVIVDGRFSGSGRYLRFRNINTTMPVFTLYNDATGNTIRNCIIEGANTITTYGTIFFGTGLVTGNDNNTITENMIRDRSDAAGIPYQAIMSTGTTGFANSDNTISNNEIFNFTNYGIQISATGNGSNWTISGNSVYYNNATVPTLTQYCIYFNPGAASTTNTISGNYLGGSAANCSGTAWTNAGAAATFAGIIAQAGTTPATSIQGNTIQNVTFTNPLNTGAFYGIQFGTGSADIGTVTGNVIGHASTAGSLTSYATGTMMGIWYSGSDNVAIQNNLVANLSHLATSASATTTDNGIYVGGGVGNITSNTVRDFTCNSVFVGVDLVGINVNSSGVSHTIANNTVYNLASTPNISATATTVVGLFLQAGNGVVQRNTIRALTNASTANSPGIHGLLITAASWTIVNNAISLGTSVANNVFIRGIQDQGTGVNNYFYNSIAVGGSSGAGINNTYAFVRISTATLTLRNNIFHNSRTGGSGNHYALGNNSSTPGTNWSSTTSDYNLFATADANTLCEWGVTSPVTRTFSAWKTSAGSDTYSYAEVTASVPASSLFADAANGDLHVQDNATAWYVNGNGIALAGYANDIDNNTRSATVAGGATDIGCDEFTPTAGPATLVATPVSGGMNVFTFAGRTLASIAWGTGGTVPSSVSLQYFPGTTPPSPTTGNFGNVYWNITASGGSGFTYDATLYYTPALLGTIASESNTRMAKRDGGVWAHFPGSTLNQSLKTVTNTGMSTFSDFALSDNTNPLPVQLVAFTAVKKGNTVELNWRTASELNSLRFAIERRSALGEAWTEIGSVASMGSTDRETAYAFIDEDLPKANTAWYRLRKIDRDGSFDFSSEVRVTLATPTAFTVFANFPNPFASSTSIAFALPSEQFVSVRVFDLSGRLLESLLEETLPEGTHSVTFNASTLPSGTYRYVVSAGSEMKSGLMILAR